MINKKGRRIRDAWFRRILEDAAETRGKSSPQAFFHARKKGNEWPRIKATKAKARRALDKRLVFFE